MEVREYQNAILEAYGKEGEGIEIFPGTEPTGKGYGTTIVIKPKAASGKSPGYKGRIIYVDGLLSTKAAEALANTNGGLERREYKINKVANPVVNDIYGNRITFDDSENNYKRFKASKELENVYNMLAFAKKAGETLTKAQADKLAKDLISSSGNFVGTPKSSIDIVSQRIMDYYTKL